MSKKKTEGHKSLLHSATRKLLFCYRIVGLFPVQGLTQHGKPKLRFNPFSINMLLFGLSIVLKTIESLSNIYQLSVMSLTLRTLVEAISDVINHIRVIFLLRLAYNWPSLIKATSEIEGGLHTDKSKVIRQSNILLVVFNITIIISGLTYTWYLFELSQICTSGESRPPFESFVVYNMQDIFQFTTYETWKGIIMTMHFCQNIYVMELFDILLMQISIYLTCYFEDFNERIRKIARNYTKNFAWMLKSPDSEAKDINWGAMRVEYTNISRLVHLVNDKISGLLFLSFGHHIILLWGLVLMVFRRGQFVDQSQCDTTEFRSVWTIYNYSRYLFVYANVIFLILRFFLGSFLATNINCASKNCALPLYEISESIGSNVEMDRLLMQIRTSTVGLSGFDFFYVTKSMMLSMAGTIVTYELMMLQFAPDFSQSTLNSTRYVT